jgi:DNA-binding MarR family transcriptional regulator
MQDVTIEAINDYDLFTKKQKKVLTTLVSVAVENVAYISVPSISKAINLALNSTYIVLRSLENSGYISRKRDQFQKNNSYNINKEKLNLLVKIYKKKRDGLNLIKK